MISTNEMKSNCFIEVDYHQGFKNKQIVGGDVFLHHKIKEENRIIAVLSDGLGSGIKANVLATLTSTMAINFISNSKDICDTAETIMKTLPVCKVRKISYSTFTIVDVDNIGNTRIIEYDNPPFILIRNNRIVKVETKLLKLRYNRYKENVLKYSEFSSQMGDRIIFFSDGVSQSGMGTKVMPLGWGTEKVEEYALSLIKNNPEISARDLAHNIVSKAYANDSYKPKDDITCGVIYFRKPRKLMVLSGPPISKEKDKEIAEMINNFDGKKIICGGTTAKIIARELNKTISVDLNDYDPEIPPCSTIEGIDLVTEGTITIGKLLEALESDIRQIDYNRKNAVLSLINYLHDSDIIYFVVGTKINEAHQDPNIPVELGLRRNLIKNIVKILEEKFLKETKLQFL
ncbi:MAG: SpoIIE family protein phosphatase [Bacteroidota bacterium]|nr:SpoIIE family protein phosphatase [Bacteroidota bacterium]MDP4190469.1 SpoIIE family protein phosphatase [Bacteroidota bacterium]MDP4194157.1 SpoIIE family protein phosphatase [Bacteroidota bacterium]